VIVAGFDEAGYGPRLGPLVVTWTAFRVPDDLATGKLCLWKALKTAVRKKHTGTATKVWIADSKLVKPRKDGMALLELGALSFLGIEKLPTTISKLLPAVGLDAARYMPGPWYDGLDTTKVPAFAWPGEIATRAALVRSALKETGIEFLGAQSCVLPEWEFNAGLAVPAPTMPDEEETDSNKADVMQREAFSPLLASLRKRFPNERIEAVADKHGGRNFYAPLLGRVFPLSGITIFEEGERCSSYKVSAPEGELAIRFEPEADSRHFCVALASMICKYLRERFMERLNDWFRERVDRELEPTAGYPGDAERFIRAIEPSLRGLGIQREHLVRAK
jgi:ribonuclease HII